MRLGQPDVQRQQARPWRRSRTAPAGTRPTPTPGRELRGAHRVERELPAAALQDAEAQQDRDRAEVRDQQVEEAGAADLRDAVLRRDQEIRRQRHRFPGDHERVGVVGQQHEAHAGEEQVVLQAEQAGRRAFAACGSSRRRRSRCRPRPRRAAPGRRWTSGSSRRWNGRSGRPISSVACSGGSAMLAAADDRERERRTSAPSGNSVRPTSETLPGPQQPGQRR